MPPAREVALYSAPDLRLNATLVFVDKRLDFNRMRNGHASTIGKNQAVPVKNAALCIKAPESPSSIIPTVRGDMPGARIQETLT